jgi:hypothetical protein
MSMSAIQSDVASKMKRFELTTGGKILHDYDVSYFRDSNSKSSSNISDNELEELHLLMS